MAETAPVYKRPEEIPPRFKKLNGVLLSPQQATTIAQRAYALGKPGRPAYDAAREEFTSVHDVKNNAFVRKAAN